MPIRFICFVCLNRFFVAENIWFNVFNQDIPNRLKSETDH